MDRILITFFVQCLIIKINKFSINVFKGAVTRYDFPSVFNSISSSDSLSTKIVLWNLSRKHSLKLIKNLMYVRISIDSSENRDFFPYKKKYWISFINRKSIVKSYLVTTSAIDSNRLTWASRLKIGQQIALCDRTLSISGGWILWHNRKV